MNRTEAERFAVLQAQLAAGEIAWLGFEALSIRLGRGSRYEPDFVYVQADGLIVCEEVKGTAGWKLDSESRTKWIAAAERNPWALFRVASKRRVRDGGGWDVQDYEPHSGMGAE
jgi:hypothetical protein